MLKYLFGSKMLGLSNNRDEDWLLFDNVDTKTARKTGCKSISFYQTLINFFIAGKNIHADPYNAQYMYQLSNGFIDDEEYPFKDFNILNHKEAWKEWLKAYINDKQTDTCATKTDILPKQFYHLLYQYYMIVENTHWISETAKSQVQKIHDLEVSSSYFYELRDLINNMGE